MNKSIKISRIAGSFVFCTLIAGITFGSPALAAPAQAQPASPTANINWNKGNLTPAQAKALNELRGRFNERANKLTAEIKVKQQGIQQQLMSPSGNPVLLRKLMNEKLALEAKLQKDALENFIAMKNILTSDQIRLIFTTPTQIR